ncbi:MAG: phospholipase [Muribaculaceae bacterium]|nr:phospholipase [Muribaculaceae bacterium]
MEVALIIAVAILAVGAVLYIHHRLTGGDSKIEPRQSEVVAAAGEADGECCRQHAVCERDSLLAAVSERVVYYDDEELDAYAGREAESYSADETEQFRDVLLTLMPDDIVGWARSIQLRGIVLPIDVRDELIMMISEARASRSHA